MHALRLKWLNPCKKKGKRLGRLSRILKEMSVGLPLQHLAMLNTACPTTASDMWAIALPEKVKHARPTVIV